jgi:SAM-dependent methyltransferase
LGFYSPDHFIERELFRLVEKSEGTLRCASVGSGRCEVEIALVQKLIAAGHQVHFSCTDLNPRLLAAGKSAADTVGVGSSMEFIEIDVNKFASVGKFDAVIAYQCLHHFIELETIFDSIFDSLRPDGLFIVSDVIGRNGHQMWPEALEVLQSFWKELPERLRVDSLSGSTLAEYDNFDYSDLGFEGVRAQDILPLLVQRFEFEVFAPFACITIPFVDRRFGVNFDPESEEDRSIIDRIAVLDNELIQEGKIKPTQLVAALCRGTPSRYSSMIPWSPKETIRHSSRS